MDQEQAERNPVVSPTATETRLSQTGDAAILCLIRPDDNSLPVAAAKALLNIRFDNNDLDHIHELVTKNQDDALTPAERADLESYLRVTPYASPQLDGACPRGKKGINK